MHRFTSLLLAVAFAAAAPAAEPDSSGSDAALKKMRDALRASMTQLQTAQAENATLTAEKTALDEKVKELNRQNNLLKDKYNSDPKYARIHKRLVEKGDLTQKESQIFEALINVKQDADLQVLQNTRLLENESYFSTQMMRLVIDQFKNKSKFNLNAESSKYINNLVVNEYINEFYGRVI